MAQTFNLLTYVRSQQQIQHQEMVGDVVRVKDSQEGNYSASAGNIARWEDVEGQRIPVDQNGNQVFDNRDLGVPQTEAQKQESVNEKQQAAEEATKDGESATKDNGSWPREWTVLRRLRVEAYKKAYAEYKKYCRS